MKFAQIVATLSAIGSAIGSAFAFAINGPAEKVINKCYEELAEYEICYVKYGDISEMELQKNCEIYKSEKCQKYFKDSIKYVPTCAEATTYHSIPKLNDIELTRNYYDDICTNNEKSRIEKIVNKCYEELSEYEDCYVKYGNVSDSELQKNCETYQSEKCQKYFENPIKYVPICDEATTYRSISKLNNMELTRQHYDDICANNEKRQIEKIINKCYEELSEYEDCYVNYVDVSESELENNCESYKSEKCQKYFEDPIKYVPTCAEATTYHSISKLNYMELTRHHYNEICAKNNTANSKKIPISTVEGRCGEGYGICDIKGSCCSKFGYCGYSESYCGTGCQPKYGLCQ